MTDLDGEPISHVAEIGGFRVRYYDSGPRLAAAVAAELGAATRTLSSSCTAAARARRHGATSAGTCRSSPSGSAR